MMKLAIDAFGPSNFPRTKLAEAIGATFSATSYIGPDPSESTRSVLKQYLGSLLGLESEVGEVTCWLEHMDDSRLLYQFVSGTALLCYSCALLKIPQGNLACRAAKLCASKVSSVKTWDESITRVFVDIADNILKLVSSSLSLLSRGQKCLLLEWNLWKRHYGCCVRAVQMIVQLMY